MLKALKGRTVPYFSPPGVHSEMPASRAALIKTRVGEKPGCSISYLIAILLPPTAQPALTSRSIFTKPFTLQQKGRRFCLRVGIAPAEPALALQPAPGLSTRLHLACGGGNGSSCLAPTRLPPRLPFPPSGAHARPPPALLRVRPRLVSPGGGWSSPGAFL